MTSRPVDRNPLYAKGTPRPPAGAPSVATRPRGPCPWGPSVDRRLCSDRAALRHSPWSGQAGFIARALTGERPFEFEWEPTHSLNAVNAREHGGMSKDEAATEIEAGRARLRSVIERMTEEDWSRAVFSFGDRPRSADVVLRRIVLPHVNEHLKSLRETMVAPR